MVEKCTELSTSFSKLSAVDRGSNGAGVGIQEQQAMASTR